MDFSLAKFIGVITPALLAIIATVLFPTKKIIVVFQEIIKYTFSSFVRYWYITVLSILLCILIYKLLPNYILEKDIYGLLILLALLLVFAIVLIFALYKDLNRKYKPMNIGIYNCLSIGKEDYLLVDSNAERLNTNIKKIVDSITQNNFCYKKGYIKINQVIIPKFIPMLKGYSSYVSYLQSRVNKEKHLAAICFIQDAESKKISLVFQYDKDRLATTEPFDKINHIVESLTNDSSLSTDKIVELTLRIYLFIFSQSTIDSVLEFKLLSDAHYLLDSAKKLLLDLQRDYNNLSNKSTKLINDFVSYWLCNIERYKGETFISQELYEDAVSPIFRAMKLNPYYPYNDYEKLKDDMTRKYAIDLGVEIDRVSGIINENIENVDNTTNNFDVIQDLSNQISYYDVQPLYQILIRILHLDTTNKVKDKILLELESLDKTNPFFIVSECEIMKHIETGKEKINAICSDQLDKCLELLNSAIAIDPNFPLLRTKYGILMFMKGAYLGNEAIINEGMKEYMRGVHIFSEMGFNLSQKVK